MTIAYLEPLSRAWVRFFSVFNKHPFHFLIFGLFVFVLLIGFVAAIILAGLMTCCIGFILFVIPYIGTVVTLPVWYTLRAFSLEYLAQFGDDYNVFPSSAPEAAGASA